MKNLVILLSFLLLASACLAYTITTTAGPNGEIWPENSIEIESGGHYFFRAYGDYDWGLKKYYVIDKWYVDGTEVQSGGWEFRLYDIHDNHNVHVTFIVREEESTVNITYGPNGYVHRRRHYYDSSRLILIAFPDPGYVVDQWYIDGQSARFGHNEFILWINHDRDVHVTFRPIILNSGILELMLSHWGEDECWTTIEWYSDCFDADLNFDRQVDMQDFAILAEHWLDEGTLYGIQTARIFKDRLESVRTAIDAYRGDHNGLLPSESGLSSEFGLLYALLVGTDSDGLHWIEGESTGPKLGPYLYWIPYNPFTGGNEIDGTRDWYYDSVTGEIVAVTGSEEDIASGDISGESLRFMKFLGIIRNAIKRYSSDHNGRFPELANFEAQMTGITDVDGVLCPVYDEFGRFGPYLERIPVNIYTGGNCVIMWDSGWSDYWYDPETGHFTFGDSGITEHGTHHNQL